MLCHYCGSQLDPPPTICPACGGKLQYRGFGTQKAEEELAELFPEARVLRMDQDSTAAKDAHEKLLAKFARHEYDIMVGTQMVAKGLDFEDVTLVGVLGIDSLLFAQGFRAYENVFSLITQVVGRSGRAKDPGFAIIQTTDPDNPVLTPCRRAGLRRLLRAGDRLPQAGPVPALLRAVRHRLCRRKGDRGGARRRPLFGCFWAAGGQAAGPAPARAWAPPPATLKRSTRTTAISSPSSAATDRRFRDLVRETLALYEQEKLPAKATVVVDLHSDGDI